MLRTAKEIHRDHVRTLARHRKEAAQRAQSYARVVTPKLDKCNPHVMYVWRSGMWMLVAFLRDKPTQKRMARWRTRYRIKPNEIVRYKSLWEAQRNGPPIDDPHVRVFVPAPKPRITVAPTEREPVKVRGTPDMPKCSFTKCKHKGTWYVGYDSGTTGNRRIINRCTRHAWDAGVLPKGAQQVMRVQRSSTSH